MDRRALTEVITEKTFRKDCRPSIYDGGQAELECVV